MTARATTKGAVLPMRRGLTALLAAVSLAAVSCAGPAEPAAPAAQAGSPAPATATSAPPATTSSSAPPTTGWPPTARPTATSRTRRPTASVTPLARRTQARSAGFPVPVSTGDATQVITVKASGSRATVTAWSKSGGSWHVVHGPWAGRVGANGVVPAVDRRQGTSTTPGGTFTMTEAFGIEADPGASLPYRHVGDDDWWVEDNNSDYYNQHRLGSQGGFDTSLPESDVNGSERLIRHTTTYRYAVVINFNRWPAVRYKGAGIFLHVSGSGATAGCVSISSSAMVTVLRWLQPSAHPRIAIG